MNIELLFKVAGVGMIVTVACQILSKSGREEQATLVSVAGIVLTLMLLIDEIASLFATVREVFGL